MFRDYVIILTPLIQYYINDLYFDRPVDLLNVNGQSFLERLILSIENKQIIIVIDKNKTYYYKVFEEYQNVTFINTDKCNCNKVDQLLFALENICHDGNTFTIIESNTIITYTLLNDFFVCNSRKKYIKNEYALGPVCFPVSSSVQICKKIRNTLYNSYNDLMLDMIDDEYLPFNSTNVDFDKIITKQDYLRILNTGYSKIKKTFQRNNSFILLPPMKKFVGVYDVIGAQLAQLMGFDGLWLGSYQISLSLGINDDETYNPNVVIKLCKDLKNANVTLPIIIDIGSGFKSERSLLEFAKYCNNNKNIIALCVDDNKYIRDNSMLPSNRRQVLSTNDFKRRIKQLKKHFRYDILFIARTELIIAEQNNLDMCVINKKCQELLNNCADIFLPHYVGNNVSYFKTIYNSFLRHYPILSIPTGLISMRPDFFEKLGINILIYANIDIRIRIQNFLKIYPNICLNHKISEFDSLPSAVTIKALIDFL